MRVLDLFCCACGASRGYVLAGCEVTGVDRVARPNYRKSGAARFVQCDAIDYLVQHGHEYDFIHASPPCQAYTKGAGKAGTRALHPDLVGRTRALLVGSGRPWVIENVEQCATKGVMRADAMLCGTMFGLGVFRHRAFEASFPLCAPEHRRHEGRVGDGKYHAVAGNPGGSSRRDGWKNGGAADWARAMGIDWMTAREMVQAIPPAYTQWVMGQYLASRAAA